MLHGIKGARVETIGERIVQEPVRGDGELPIVALLESQARQGPEIVGVAHNAPLLLEYFPIARASAVAMRGFETFTEIRLNPIVVEKRIVDVEQKDRGARRAHSNTP